jgi:hypothetical protein
MKLKYILLVITILWSTNTIADFRTNTVSSSNINAITDIKNQSVDILKMSQNILTIAKEMETTPGKQNIVYVNAMLSLSKDIGSMADRIGDMANKIVATELQIGIMADRILETQHIQSNNLALAEANVLMSQQIFTNILIRSR